MIKILLADDHAVVRQGYAALLKTLMTDVELIEAATGTDAALLYIQQAPDVLVLDINLPDLSGIEVCRQVRQRDPQARVLMFSMYEDPSIVREALDAGALGYLSKSSPPDHMLVAIKAVVAGEKFLDQRLSRSRGVVNVVNSDSVAHSTGRITAETLDSLPAREREIAERLLEGKSNLVIASELGISAKTVANRATVIRQKFGVQSTAELIRKVMG